MLDSLMRFLPSLLGCWNESVVMDEIRIIASSRPAQKQDTKKSFWGN
jgi:hypothetical protein